MLKPLVPPLRGALSLAFVVLNTIFWCIPLLTVSLLKLLVPMPDWRNGCGRILVALAQRWVWMNSLGLDLTKSIRWDVQGLDGLSPDDWYILIANHQTMVDIVVLQKVFHRKIPMLKFFIKKELMWVPLLGLAWWALDFPFMKRTGSTERDMAAARKACEKFSLSPVTVMNFVEGTRFSERKRKDRSSPHRNLLKPKAGGIAVVLSCMGRRVRSVLDVTIVYPQGAPGLWTFLCSKTMPITVRVKQHPVSEQLLQSALEDNEARLRLNAWLNTLWHEKDDAIDTLRANQCPSASSLNT
ncbi:MAG: acyltransferase [Syntrophobacteraceae bacterium]